jgi:phosphoribosyl 1,2-cyclic phosphate phosphodiesterase
MATPAFDITFLGTGTSIGVPVIGCGCPVCTSGDPVNQRLRCSIHVRAADGLEWIVDTGPDLRTQCLREGICRLDAVLYTHEHTDHIMGFDDLRRFTVPADAELPIHANASCLARIEAAFHYAFNGENRYVGYLKPQPHIVTGPFRIGETTVTPLPVDHGKVDALGYRFDCGESGGFAYLPDVKSIPSATRERMRGLDVLILDALQEQPHPTHLSVAEAVEVIADLQPRQTWLTHFSCRMDYRVVGPKLPVGVDLARDGLQVQVG